jgi:hypothetical protein
MGVPGVLVSSECNLVLPLRSGLRHMAVRVEEVGVQDRGGRVVVTFDSTQVVCRGGCIGVLWVVSPRFG